MTNSSIRAAMTARLLGEASGPLCGIYVITHRETGKRYVGMSGDILKRWGEHRAAQDRSSKIAAAVRKYGPDAFDWEVVERHSREGLAERESYYISQWGFDSANPESGYNLTYGGEGVPLSDGARDRQREGLRRAYAEHPTFRTRVCEALRRMNSDPEFRAKRSEDMRRRAEEPTYRARQAENTRRRFTDPRARVAHATAMTNSEPFQRAMASPAVRAKHADSTRRANRTRGDQQEHALVNVDTGAVERGKRWELCDRLGLDSGNLAALVKGRYKTTKGYRLARPEEL